MVAILFAIISIFAFRLRSRAALELKLVAIEHQLAVLRRQRPGRPQLSSLDRLLWVWLYQIWPQVIGAWTVKRSWKDKQSRIQAKWRDRFCTPIFRNRFKTRMRRLLDKNPIAWLQQYSWGNRLNKWGWCLLIVIAECVLVGDSQLTLLWVGQYALAQLLILGLAFIESLVLFTLVIIFVKVA